MIATPTVYNKRQLTQLEFEPWSTAATAKHVSWSFWYFTCYANSCCVAIIIMSKIYAIFIIIKKLY